MSESEKGTIITLNRPKLEEVHFEIIGLTNLLCCALPPKIEDPEKKSKRKAKAAKGGLPDAADHAEPTGSPEDLFRASLYPLPDNQGYGFPSAGIQASCATALQRFNPINPKFAKDTPPVFYGATFMLDELIPIVGDGPHMRHDIGRNAKKRAIDLYRGEFKAGWKMLVRMEFDANVITLDRLTNALDSAGRKVGIGAWRPECRGRFGRFEVVSATLVKTCGKEHAA
jgi:hypothetical protein